MSKPNIAEGIEFRVEVRGVSPLDAARKAQRLADNLVRDWPIDWPIEIDTAYWTKEAGGWWRATLEGYARDDGPEVAGPP